MYTCLSTHPSMRLNGRPSGWLPTTAAPRNSQHWHRNFRRVHMAGAAEWLERNTWPLRGRRTRQGRRSTTVSGQQWLCLTATGCHWWSIIYGHGSGQSNKCNPVIHGCEWIVTNRHQVTIPFFNSRWWSRIDYLSPSMVDGGWVMQSRPFAKDNSSSCKENFHSHWWIQLMILVWLLVPGLFINQEAM